MIFKKITKRKQQNESIFENENEKSFNFLIKNISKKCNIIAQKEQLNSINYARIFQTSINVNEQRFTIMINSSATENFISQAFVDRKEFFIRKKNDEYDLIIINDNLLFNENERMSKKTTSLSISI